MSFSLTTADQARLSRWAAWGVCIIAALIALWFGVRLFWLLLPQGDVTTERAPATTVNATKASMSIAKWHLFGNPQNLQMRRLASNAPATTLHLTLRGTWALDDPQRGIALIQDEHGNEKPYRVGDTVSADAKLAGVYADHVVLDHEGAHEKLSLPQPEQHALPLPEANQRNLQSGSGRRASSIPPAYVAPQMAHGAVDWRQAQKKLRLDPDELARQVHVEPVFKNGHIAGARLSGSGRVGELMQQAGLRPTDLITAVNGNALSSVSNPQALMDKLKDASQLQVTVMRNGKPATLSLSLQ